MFGFNWISNRLDQLEDDIRTDIRVEVDGCKKAISDYRDQRAVNRGRRARLERKAREGAE